MKNGRAYGQRFSPDTVPDVRRSALQRFLLLKGIKEKAARDFCSLAASATQRVSAKRIANFSSGFLPVLNEVFQHLRHLCAGGLPLGA